MYSGFIRNSVVTMNKRLHRCGIEIMAECIGHTRHAGNSAIKWLACIELMRQHTISQVVMALDSLRRTLSACFAKVWRIKGVLVPKQWGIRCHAFDTSDK